MAPSQVNLTDETVLFIRDDARVRTRTSGSIENT
jgi:hypothetical protein